MTVTDFRPVPATAVPTALALEILSFPADEAASLEALTYRQSKAPELFQGLWEDDELIGFICATLTSESTLKHASMSTHVPSGSYVAIHSLCIAPSRRRQGLASLLLKNYLDQLRTAQAIRGAVLITHEELVPLYESAGFTMVGKSSVAHGERTWFEMTISLLPLPPAPVVRSPGATFVSFAQGMEQLVDGEGRNKGELYCPRAECRSLMLHAGAGKWVRDAGDFLLPELPRPLDQAPTSEPSSKPGFWSVPSPLTFENIGFSRNAPPPSVLSSTSTAAPSLAGTIKFLICADCDHGPLGWHDTQGRDLGLEVAAENEGVAGGAVRTGREFLLDVRRVRYKMP